MPPASSRPTICEELGGAAAKPMRSTVAAMMPIEDGLGALVLGQAGGRQADDDGVVARQHQVDHDDLEQGRQGFGGEEFAHAVPAFR